jgi:hypothetical protein
MGVFHFDFGLWRTWVSNAIRGNHDRRTRGHQIPPPTTPADLAGLSPRAQEYYFQVFKPAFQALQNAVRGVPLAVLVWGPGESAPDLYRKRVQIRDELRRRGHMAMFGEELASPESSGLSQKGIEFLQAQSADLIVILQASYGSVSFPIKYSTCASASPAVDYLPACHIARYLAATTGDYTITFQGTGQAKFSVSIPPAH